MARLLMTALAALGLGTAATGCAAPQPGTPAHAPYSAPYDPENNPFCGALGNCRPLQTTPYPMRGNAY